MRSRSSELSMTISIYFVLLLCLNSADAFLAGNLLGSHRSPACHNFLLKQRATSDDSSSIPSKDSDSSPESSNVDKVVDKEGSAVLYEELKHRQVQLDKGIGKRYKTRTQKGFLNIHSDPHSGPYNLDNVIGQLQEGQIVKSIEPSVDDWIHHDAGGWSISNFEGFTFLEPLN